MGTPDLPNAIRYFDRAVKIAEKIYGPDTPTHETLFLRLRLGDIYGMAGDNPKAVKHLEKTLSFHDEKAIVSLRLATLPTRLVVLKHLCLCSHLG